MSKEDRIQLIAETEKTTEYVHINEKDVEVEGRNGTENVVSTRAKYGAVSWGTSKSGLRRRNLDRVVTKEGVCTFVPRNVEKQGRKFLNDIFTTLLEVRWRWTLFCFCMVYFLSWLGFAVLWYAILYYHGDVDHFEEEGWRPCVTGIQNFTSAFLYSVETQQTTGYGYYHLTERCATGVILFCIQSIVGVILEGLLVGLVFVKMSRAKKRSETIMFSKNAVISLRDGVLCFMFRVGDMRITPILEAHVRCQIVKKRVTAEGEVIAYHQEELSVCGDGEKEDKILMFWPTIIIHQITDTSPLKSLTEGMLHANNHSFEIIVVLEGIVEATGNCVQARSSYLPSEILWGQRFQNLTSCKTNSGFRAIDYSKFHETMSVPMTTLDDDSSYEKFRKSRV